MDCADTNRRLEAIETDVNALRVDAEWGRDDVDAATEAWDRIDRLITNLGILRRDLAIALARRTDDEHTAVTAGGLVTVHRRVETSEQWDGAGVLMALAEEVIDRDGELIGAIRLDVAQRVLPACGPGQTSSKWKLSELRQVIPKADEYRKVQRGAALIARGPQSAALRAATRRSSTESSSAPVDE
jgi:hypothetical protein